MEKRNLAAIDLGTNSFHLVIVKVKQNSSFEILGKDKESVRLGSGAGLNEIITPEAMERGIACLKRFKLQADRQSADVRAIATSALREAKNRADFLKKAKTEVGIDIEVVSGVEEARLIYYGILQGLQIFDKKILMIDIGGGSTEILIGQKGNILFSQSLKLGSIRLTDKFFIGDPISNSDISHCKMHVEGMISHFKKEIEKHQPEIVVGASGTIQSIAQMNISTGSEELQRSLNNYTFSIEDLKKVRGILDSADTLKKRTKIPGLDARRADIIVAGSVILEKIFDTFQLKELTVSDYALREGIIYDSIQKAEGEKKSPFHNLDNIRLTAITNVSNSFPFEKEHSLHVKNLALKIFDELLDIHKCSGEEREYLEAAAILHEIGLGISHSSHHKHSYYIIRNAEAMVGFNFTEIEIIALIARYHRKSSPKPKHLEFQKLSAENQLLVKKLAGILRIADGLDRNHKQNIEDLNCEIQSKIILFKLRAKSGADTLLEIWSAQQKKELFEEVFDLKAGFVIV
ncbi:MAG: Ppx/GppA family phosphatase [Leptospiraceae bacterium]|nr:Ppx/GppA family phosphatase [Leptospiraceae bacterium]MCK6381783.1 Ppx/GppA family phosphatase [Leptospiraceae bacterium]